jgi:hypothetical protein
VVDIGASGAGVVTGVGAEVAGGAAAAAGVAGAGLDGADAAASSFSEPPHSLQKFIPTLLGTPQLGHGFDAPEVASGKGPAPKTGRGKGWPHS